MADLDDFEFWHSIMGDSNNKQSDFEGFTHEQVAGRDDESDIDLDLVVNSDRLLAKFESSSEDSDESPVEDNGDAELPAVAGPSQWKKQDTEKCMCNNCYHSLPWNFLKMEQKILAFGTLVPV